MDSRRHDFARSERDILHAGLYFVRVMTSHSEFLFAKGYDLGCNFWDKEGSNKQKVTPKLVPFSICVLAVVANEIKLGPHKPTPPPPPLFDKFGFGFIKGKNLLNTQH